MPSPQAQAAEHEDNLGRASEGSCLLSETEQIYREDESLTQLPPQQLCHHHWCLRHHLRSR